MKHRYRYLRRYKKIYFERPEIRFICSFYLIKFHAPGSVPVPAFPIRIRIQERQINAKPCGSGYKPTARGQLRHKDPKSKPAHGKGAEKR